MRMMLKVIVDTEAGNRAIRDNTLGKVIETFTKEAKPEASYFTLQNGQRTAFFFFNHTDNANIPVLAEPLFMQLNAHLEWTPAMNTEELRRGLTALANAR